MPNPKEFAIQVPTLPNAKIWMTVVRLSDHKCLDYSSGAFVESIWPLPVPLQLSYFAPAVFEYSENREIWQDGSYRVSFFVQSTTTPRVTDTFIKSATLFINADEEVTLETLRSSSTTSLSLLVNNKPLDQKIANELSQVLKQLRALTNAVEKQSKLKV